MNARPASIEVRELGFRWGSCGRDGRLFFYRATNLLPPRIADYVIVPELAHLFEPNHSREFWQRVQRAMPDSDDRRLWLAEQEGALGWLCCAPAVALDPATHPPHDAARARATGVAFFFKQWGGVNKKATGRMLDGRVWDELPVRTSTASSSSIIAQ